MNIGHLTPGQTSSGAIDKTKRIGIIGGGGKMGEFFVRICKERGWHNLCFADTNQEAAKRMNEKHGLEPIPAAALARECDITIVSVPIKNTEKVIDQVGPHIKADALFAHFTSIQGPALRAMQQFPQCEHLGIHIMAAPSNNVTLKNTNVILVPEAEGGSWFHYIQGFFGETEARVSVMDANKHDLTTALLQAQVHLNNFLFGYVLRKARRDWQIELKDLDALQTPLFLLSKLALGRMFASGNPGLYADIQMHNPEVLKVLGLFQKGVSSFLDIIKTKDEASFRTMFERTSRYFGDYHSIWSKLDSDELLKNIKINNERHVEAAREQIRGYYAGEYTAAARDSGCLDAVLVADRSSLVPPPVKKLGEHFMAISILLNIGDFITAAEQAKMVGKGLNKLKHQPHLKKPEALKNKTDQFIKMCQQLAEMEREIDFQGQ
jgi:prephenate dehydrogenase